MHPFLFSALTMVAEGWEGHLTHKTSAIYPQSYLSENAGNSE